MEPAINWMMVPKSLHRKWLEITKHLFINGCMGLQSSPFLEATNQITNVS